MSVLDAVVQRGGHFLFTSYCVDTKGIGLFLNKVEKIIDLGSPGRCMEASNWEEERNWMILHENIREKIELGSKVGQGRYTSMVSQLCPIQKYPQMEKEEEAKKRIAINECIEEVMEFTNLTAEQIKVIVRSFVSGRCAYRAIEDEWN